MHQGSAGCTQLLVIWLAVGSCMLTRPSPSGSEDATRLSAVSSTPLHGSKPAGQAAAQGSPLQAHRVWYKQRQPRSEHAERHAAVPNPEP